MARERSRRAKAVTDSLHLDKTDLLTISGNMSNLASIIFPFVLIYLNTKLPKPAKARWWSSVVLVLNVLFFGFFFVTVASRIVGVIGSFLGGVIDQLFSRLIAELSDFNSVNLIAAFLGSMPYAGCLMSRSMRPLRGL